MNFDYISTTIYTTMPVRKAMFEISGTDFDTKYVQNYIWWAESKVNSRVTNQYNLTPMPGIEPTTLEL